MAKFLPYFLPSFFPEYDIAYTICTYCFVLCYFSYSHYYLLLCYNYTLFLLYFFLIFYYNTIIIGFLSSLPLLLLNFFFFPCISHLRPKSSSCISFFSFISDRNWSYLKIKNLTWFSVISQFFKFLMPVFSFFVHILFTNFLPKCFIITLDHTFLDLLCLPIRFIAIDFLNHLFIKFRY